MNKKDVFVSSAGSDSVTGNNNDTRSKNDLSDRTGKSSVITNRLWTHCENCGTLLYVNQLQENHHVCIHCQAHFPVQSCDRILQLVDAGTWVPFCSTLSSSDPFSFTDTQAYSHRLREAKLATKVQEGIQTGVGTIDGSLFALGIMDFYFMDGSMGCVIGEKLTKLIEYATLQALPLVIITTSSGARMQEGILSLFQMSKITSALDIHQNCGQLAYISVVTSPTIGGVTASFALLGDIVIAEPKATIGFAGKKVLEQVSQQPLPLGFQTSEFLLHHGFVDIIIPRIFLQQALSEFILMYTR
jgi:acetyl-CoA carboxylase carboxyl transferase subunit beta